MNGNKGCAGCLLLVIGYFAFVILVSIVKTVLQAVTSATRATAEVATDTATGMQSWISEHLVLLVLFVMAAATVSFALRAIKVSRWERRKSVEWKPTFFGQSIAYACPHCDVELTSHANEVRDEAECPDCEKTFVVPGYKLVREREREAERKRQKRAEEQWMRTEGQRLKNEKLEEERLQRESQLEKDREEKEKLLQQCLNFSTDPRDYHMVGPDYRRGGPVDSHYERKFRNNLSQAFNGHCANCGDGMSLLAFDHFWLASSKGGIFAMRRKLPDGSIRYVNNCIPLCTSCNSSKGSKCAREFFDESKMQELIEICESVEAGLNSVMVESKDNWRSQPTVDLDSPNLTTKRD